MKILIIDNETFKKIELYRTEIIRYIDRKDIKDQYLKMSYPKLIKDLVNRYFHEH